MINPYNYSKLIFIFMRPIPRCQSSLASSLRFYLHPRYPDPILSTFHLLRDGLDLDECGGRMVLRVLLQLCSQGASAALVSGALALLFRHFSQRQEVLAAFKQVCSLFSCHFISVLIDLVKSVGLQTCEDHELGSPSS